MGTPETSSPAARGGRGRRFSLSNRRLACKTCVPASRAGRGRSRIQARNASECVRLSASKPTRLRFVPVFHQTQAKSNKSHRDTVGLVDDTGCCSPAGSLSATGRVGVVFVRVDGLKDPAIRDNGNLRANRNAPLQHTRVSRKTSVDQCVVWIMIHHRPDSDFRRLAASSSLSASGVHLSAPFTPVYSPSTVPSASSSSKRESN